MRDGHGVREACSGVEGLDHFPREAADVVVTDLEMPPPETARPPRRRVTRCAGSLAPSNTHVVHASVWPGLPARGPARIDRLVPEGTARPLRG